MGRNIGAQGSVTATGVIATLDVSECEPNYVGAVGGTFVGTALVEISNDGTTFAQFGSALTAPGSVKVDVPCKQVRVRCSAYTSGTIIGFVSKHQS